MTETLLRTAAEEFVDRLNSLVAATIKTDTRFVVALGRNGQRANIRAIDYPDSRSDGFPLVRDNDDPEAPALLLLARFAVEIGEDDDHLQVVSSTVGLWVDITGGRKDPRPLIRVEYDRHRVAGDRAAAHVHLHAHSPEMAWIYGSSGQPAPDLHSLHFPVGGQRFRPTLEDFLLFLERENLYTDFKDGWRATTLESLRGFEETQAVATTRRYHQVAADTLARLGYVVTPPSSLHV